MTITVRGNSFQAVVYYEGKRYRQQFKNRYDALQWEVEAKSCLMRGEEPPDKQFKRKPGVLQNLGDLFEYTFNHYWKDMRSADTSHINGSIVVELIGAETLVKNIDTIKINNFIQKLSGHGNSNATINRKLSALSKMLDVAIQIGVIDKRPTWSWQKESVGRIRYFTLEEEKKMIETMNHFGSRDYGQFILFLCDTGFRKEEALNTKWSDFKLNLITIDRTKNDLPRSVPITDRIKSLVEDVKDRKGGPFLHLSKSGFRQAWDRMRVHLKYDTDKNFTPHVCRHTYISRLAMAGVPFPTIQRLAGHKSFQTTLRYIHLAPESFNVALSSLNRLHNPVQEHVA